MQTSWHLKGDAPVYPPLAGDADADVVIIGGGLAGVLAAYTLSHAGKSVIVLEKDTLGGGVTYHTTAFLTHVIDTGLSDLVRIYGPQRARLVWQSGADAIEQFDRIIRDKSIDCEFVRCPAHIYARTESEFAGLKAEAGTIRGLSFSTALKHDDALHFPNAGYLEVHGQAKFHPLKFLRSLAAISAEAGVRIFEHTAVTALSETGSVKVTTASGAVVTARDVIVTTHMPFNNPKATSFKKGTYKSYALEVHTAPGRIPEGLYWDSRRPYDYFRVDHRDDGDRIIVGGADHRAELPLSQKKCFGAVERYLKGVLGDTPYKVVQSWSGPIIESSDGLPLIGEYAPHRYLATAFSGNGMTYSMVAAMLFRDLIAGAENSWKDVYDPKRSLKPLALLVKGLDYVKEFFGGAVRNTFR